MAKERSIDWYKTAIKNGLAFQNKYGNATMWSTYKAYYRHNFASTQLPVNLVFSVLRSLVPQVYFRNPIIMVTPTKPGLEHELHARLVQDIDNWLLREINVKYQIKRMIVDAFLCGTATGFVGYDSQYGFSPDNTIPETEGAASLTQFDKQGNRIEYNAHIGPGMPWFLRSRPEDTVYPWGCESAESAEWVATRSFRPVEDMKKDPKYKNTSDLKGSFVHNRTTAEGTEREEESSHTGLGTDHEWVELWQIHDAKTKEVLALAMNHDKFLRQEEDHCQIDGIPAESLVFNADPDYVYGISDAKIIEPQLLELIEIRTQAMKHRRVDILKLLYRKGAIPKEQVDKLLSPEVMAAIAVEGDSPLRDVVLPLQGGAGGILADMQNAAEAVRQDVREMVGFSRAATGEYQGKTHISSKETEVVHAANQIRVDERRDIVADLLTKIIRRFNQKIFTYWKSPMVRNIVGPDGARWWLRFSGDEIKSEYTYKIDPNNGVPPDPRVRRQEATEMAHAWSQMNMGLVKQGMPVPAEIQRYFFSQYDGLDVDKVLAQQGGMQQGPGQNPGQAVPPEVAAQLMQRGGGR